MLTNTTDNMALEWLINVKNYSKDSITYSYTDTPGFVCTDGTRYEPKYLYINKLMFTNREINLLKPDDYIIVFDSKGFVKEFKWKDRNTSGYKISTIKTKPRLVISVKDERALNELKKIMVGFKNNDEFVKAVVYAYDKHPYAFKTEPEFI